MTEQLLALIKYQGHKKCLQMKSVDIIMQLSLISMQTIKQQKHTAVQQILYVWKHSCFKGH